MQSSIKNVESGEDTPKPLILIMFITTLIVGMAAFGIKKIIMDKKYPTTIKEEEKVIGRKEEKKGSAASVTTTTAAATVTDVKKNEKNEKKMKNEKNESDNTKVKNDVKKDDEGNDNDNEEDDDEDDDEEDYSDDDDSIEETEIEIKNNYTVSDGPFKMVLLVNMSLGMGKGKMCAQCGHATLGAYRTAVRYCDSAILWWHRMGQVREAERKRESSEEKID